MQILLITVSPGVCFYSAHSSQDGIISAVVSLVLFPLQVCLKGSGRGVTFAHTNTHQNKWQSWSMGDFHSSVARHSLFCSVCIHLRQLVAGWMDRYVCCCLATLEKCSYKKLCFRPSFWASQTETDAMSHKNTKTRQKRYTLAKQDSICVLLAQLACLSKNWAMFCFKFKDDILKNCIAMRFTISQKMINPLYKCYILASQNKLPQFTSWDGIRRMYAKLATISK